MERVSAEGEAHFDVREGDPPLATHLRGLEWLLDEHPYDALPPEGTPFEGLILLEIARTEIQGGRVGHAYALNSGPLGAPATDGARGILRRYISHRLRR